MKPIAKICLIVAAVAAALGLIGVGAGIAMGASAKDIADMARYELHLSREKEQEIPAEDYTMTPDETLSHKDTASEHHAAADIPSDAMAFGNASTREFKLDMGAGEVQIYTHEGDGILVTGDTGRLTCEEDGEEVSLKYHRKHYTEPMDLQVYLPARGLDEIELEFGAADVYIEAMEGNDISVCIGAGNLEADSIKALRSAELEVGTGAMSIGYLEGKALDFDCGIGSLEMVLQGKQSDYVYILDCGVGAINLGADSYSGLGRETRIDNTVQTGVAKYVEAECGIGEITIEFEEE